MKIFFDTEFTGLHAGTTLLSLGLISEDNKKFYAEFNDYDESQINEWIKDNVVAHMSYKDVNEYIPELKENAIPFTGSVSLKSNKETVKAYLTQWFAQFDSVELVSDCCHYDMVLLINIFGTAFDLPSHVCPACYDVNQDISKFHQVDGHTAFDINREEILESHNIHIEGAKHNALYDAKVIKELYFITNK